MSARPEPVEGRGLRQAQPERFWSQPLTQLVLSGTALFVVSAIGLLIPGSIFVYPHSINASEPMTVLYAFQGGWIFLLAALVLLCGCFLLALRAATGADSRRATVAAIGVAAGLAALFVPIYPSSSQDLFHNIASARTLGVYGENPLMTAPIAHPQDPLVQQVVAWREVSSFYGPLFYAASVIPSRLAGDDILRNLLAFKTVNGLALLALALLAGEAAELLARGRRTQAIVMVGWNPLLLYENVANGHNDVLMMVLAAAALLLAVKGRAIGGLVTSGLSAAVKYPSAPLAPILWVWSWKRGGRSQRLALVALAIAAAVVGAAAVVLFAAQIEMGKEAAIGRPPVRSLIALLDYGLQPLVGANALSAARVICWAAFLIVFLLSVRRLDASASSLFHGSFWVMAAITLLTVRQIYPSYLIWFVALGAILFGSTAWEIALLASLSGLLSNLVFTDWAAWEGSDDFAFMAVFFGVPAVLLALRRWWLAPLALTWPRSLRIVRSTR